MKLLWDAPARCFVGGFLVGLAADPHLPWWAVAGATAMGIAVAVIAGREVIAGRSP